MEAKIKDKIAQALSNGVFSAAVVGVVRADGSRAVIPGGSFETDGRLAAVHKDSIFDVASVTKSIPTASLALKLIDEGRLHLSDQLVRFVPEFDNSDREKVLIKHLLTQALDYDFRLSAYKDKSPEEILNLILTTEFKSKPGTKYYYSNATSILLGLVVERLMGEPLDQLGAKYFFKPLAMERTGFRPLEKFSKSEIVPTEIQAWRSGLIQGEVHDESAYALQKKLIVGSAGLFSTAPDLLNFLEMLLHGGSLNGKRYLSPSIIGQMQTNQLADLGLSAGLGWELKQPHYMGRNCRAETFGKTGFTGCSVACDIKRGAAFAILSNYTYPSRKPDAGLINEFRSAIADIVWMSL